MINTEIIEIENINNYTCFEESLKMVNNLIEKEGITREDIIEYKTKNWKSKEDFYHYNVTISWWLKEK